MWYTCNDLLNYVTHVYFVCEEPYIHNPLSNTCFRLVSGKQPRDNAKSNCEAEDEFLLTFRTASASVWFRNKVRELQSANSGELGLVNGVLNYELRKVWFYFSTNMSSVVNAVCLTTAIR